MISSRKESSKEGCKKLSRRTDFFISGIKEVTTVLKLWQKKTKAVLTRIELRGSHKFTHGLSIVDKTLEEVFHPKLASGCIMPTNRYMGVN